MTYLSSRRSVWRRLPAVSFVLCLVPGFGQPAFAQSVVINEIMQNPAVVSDGNGEWFEVHNTTSSPIDINGWTIEDNGTDGQVINNGGPLDIPAGGFLVLGVNADIGINGGVVVNYMYEFPFFLSNGSDELVLRDTSLDEVDRVEWDGGAIFPDPTGASMSLVDPALDNNAGANWCTSATPYGAGDLGTPGAVNVCPDAGPPFGACNDPATLIFDVQGSGFSSPMNGDSGVVLQAVVVGDFQESNQLRGFFLQEEDADVDADPATSDGIFVFDNSFGTDVVVGDVHRAAALAAR